MEKSQLVQVISSLTTIERKKLLKFTASPYHNSRSELTVLCQSIIKSLEIPDYFPKKQWFYNKMYPQTAYEDKKMRYAISQLLQLTKDFLAIEQFQKNRVDKQLLFSEAMQTKGLNTQFSKAIYRAGQLLKEQPLRNKSFHYYQHNIFYQQLLHNIKTNNKLDELSRQMSDAMTAYLIAANLEVACASLIFKSLKNTTFQLDFIDSVLAFLKNNNRFFEFPAVSIYYNAYQMLTGKDQDHYFAQFYQDIKAASPLFPITELNNLFTIAINHCIKQINLGKSDYLRSIFEIYKNGIENEVLLDNGIIRINTYLNIAQTGLMLKEYAWAEQFIHQYKNKVEPELRHQAFTLNMAVFYNAKHEYRKVMKMLSTIGFDDIGMEVTARRMLLKIYFELQEQEALFSLVDSFKNYIYRHKEIGYHKTHYLNLLKYTKKLASLNPANKAAKEKLKATVEQTDALADKKWLLSQF